MEHVGFYLSPNVVLYYVSFTRQLGTHLESHGKKKNLS